MIGSARDVWYLPNKIFGFVLPPAVAAKVGR
jgi:hypothetical protein